MIGMTIAEFLTGGYFWGPAIFAIIAFSLLARHEKNQNKSYLNHPSQKFQKHDEWYQKKYGIS